MTRDAFLHLIAHLRLNREPPVKPYKPILVAAVVLLIHKGTIRSPQVFLDGALRSAFFQLFDALFPQWPLAARPKPYDPFRALATEGLWTLVPKSDRKGALERDLRAGVWNVLGKIQHAKLDAEVFGALASDPAFRIRCIDVIAHAYRGVLPSSAAKTMLGHFGPDRKTWELQESLTERAIEEQLERRWEAGTLYRELGVRLADPDSDHIQRRQVSTPNNNIDLLGFQEGAKTWWVLELKLADSSRNAVAQALAYASWVREEHARRSQQVQAAVLTDVTSRALLGAAKEGRVQVWTYSPDGVLAGRLDFSRAA
jgi:hypothetical protein